MAGATAAGGWRGGEEATTRRVGLAALLTSVLAALLALAGCAAPPTAPGVTPPDDRSQADAAQLLYRSDAFTVTAGGVTQGELRAVAHSRRHVESSYQRAAVEVNFKFSLNGDDSELPPGDDHLVYLRPRDRRVVTPVHTFGVLDPVSTPEPRSPRQRAAARDREEGPVEVTFRVDLSEALATWAAGRTYEPPYGELVPAGSFEALYVVGNVSPLSWDFDALEPGHPAQLTDPDGDGVYETTLTFDARFARPLDDDGDAVWRLSRDLSRFPAHRSPQPLVDALHHLALEELLELADQNAAADDPALAGTFAAGGRWPGVWTRDHAWSSLLATVFVAPEAVRAGLLARVHEAGRVIQDSGSGGSWPVSTDRVAWAAAAWELYAVTGDRDWLRTAHDMLRRSLEADLAVARDPATGLFRGETTFLDWRAQSYPAWMQPADIGTSYAAGTNALHYAAHRALGRMARELGEPAQRWDGVADGVRRGLERELWREAEWWAGAAGGEAGGEGEDSGPAVAGAPAGLASFLYGPGAQAPARRAEAMGRALAVIFGAVDRGEARRQVAATPVVGYGVPSFWPYLPDQPPYHNAGVWPQVVAFHAWAAADAGNGAAVEHALGNLLRGAGLFLTNKENWVAATGHFEGTEVNSDRFQASAAAQLSIAYRVLFGLRLHADALEVRPFVPEPYAGTRSLGGLRYRDATFTVTVHGHGAGVREARLDGEPVEPVRGRGVLVPADLAGEHTLEVFLDGEVPAGGLNRVENVASPATPRARFEDGELRWPAVPGAARYEVYREGEWFAAVAGEVAAGEAVADDAAAGAGDARSWRSSGTAASEAAAGGEGTGELRRGLVVGEGVARYQVRAVSADGLASFLSEPVRVGPESAVTLVPAPGGPVRLGADQEAAWTVEVEVPADALYLVDVSYANGAGPVSYGYACAVRGLVVDGAAAGTLLMPQRAQRRWDVFGYGNALPVRLAAGRHTLALELRPEHRNMTHGGGDDELNDAVIEHVRLTRLATPPR